MPESTLTLYDEVPYPSALYPHTHPDRLATMAALFGLKVAPVEACRVLELGCGDGTNLIAMAYALPRSQFVGIDLARRPIATGQETIKELGLSNISLRQLDLLDTTPDLGPFDFIIAHGLYSWVPQAVRDKLLALCGAFLTENGVAYVSYNAYPGCHFRDLTRGMMRYHVAKFSDPNQKVQQARAFLKFLAESREEPELYHQILKGELHQALTRPETALFHDDLSSVNQPFYFYEFIDHASSHGLQYLSEANLWAMEAESYSPDVRALLDKLDPADVISREQYYDFVECRRFRRTLLCRKGVILDRSLQPERLYGLRFAGEIRPMSEVPDLRSASPEIFRALAGSELEISRPLAKAAFTRLGTIWPQSIAFYDLVEASQGYLGTDHGGHTSPNEEAKQELGRALLQAHLAGCVEIHAHRTPFVTDLSERPTASSLARLQLRKGISISTLRHEHLRIEDSLSRQLILLLDGTRDRAALLKHLGELANSSAVGVNHNSKTARDVRQISSGLRDGLDTNLASLARLAVLVG
jgi:methyltransferase-like protein/predicted O-methyltransferase YrrM